MTVTTSDIGARGVHPLIFVVRRLALGAGWLVTGIGSRWNAFVDSAQLGPSPYQAISRHTGGRI